jgi:hypothetical protein
LFMHLSICLFIHPYICCPLTHLFVQIVVHLIGLLSVFLSTSLSVHLIAYPYMCLSDCRSIHPFICLFVYPCVFLSVIQSSLYFSISLCPSACLPVHPSIWLCKYLSKCPSVYADSRIVSLSAYQPVCAV